MIKTDFYMERTDGVKLVRTYSDAGMYIMRDGIMYEEAIDPEECGRVYTETDEKIPTEEDEDNEVELSYDEALSLIMGEVV